MSKPTSFPLSFVNAAEDVPRLIRAYGRACDGEFALVLRPTEALGVLVLVQKTEARVWRAAGSSDAPAMPSSPISAAEAVALVKTEQKAVPKAGPITLRGQWSGSMRCDGGAPCVELVRKLAAYGVLRIVSGAAGWTWTVERAERWFSRPGADTGTAATLVRAIEAGLARAMGLLGEACSVRDSRRRAAVDAGFAVEHPIRAAKEGKDPTERLAGARAKRAPAERATEGAKRNAAKEEGSTEMRPTRDRAARKTGGKPRARRAPEADAAKDERLLAAFGEAVAAAVKGLPLE